jgi:hypothetical protein
MNSLDENYNYAVLLPAVLTFPLFHTTIFINKTKKGGNHES